MNADPKAKTQTKLGWDKRAWRWALAFCVLVFGLEAVGNSSYFRERVSEDAADISAFVGALLGFLIFPPILSGISRRRTFFWAYLPPLAFGLLYLLMSVPDLVRMYVSNGTVSGEDLLELLESIGFCAAIPVVAAGPVCLFRVFRRRANRRQRARDAVMEEAIHTVREGVWPPPSSGQGPG